MDGKGMGEALQYPFFTPHREDYTYFCQLQTRWSDNDMYGHLNNVNYNRLFEQTGIHFSMEHGRGIPVDAKIRPVMAESMTRFRYSLSFPDSLIGALRVEHLGRTSARYGVALFREDRDDAAAYGYMSLVFVDFENGSIPAPPQKDMRALLERFMKTS